MHKMIHSLRNIHVGSVNYIAAVLECVIKDKYKYIHMHVNSYPCLHIQQISLIVKVPHINPSKQNTPVLAHEGKGMSTQCGWFLSCGDLGSPCFCVGNGTHDWAMYTSDVWTWLFITNLHSRKECNLAGHTYLPCSHTGHAQEERGRGKNTWTGFCAFAPECWWHQSDCSKSNQQ